MRFSIHNFKEYKFCTGLKRFGYITDSQWIINQYINIVICIQKQIRQNTRDLKSEELVYETFKYACYATC